MKEFAIVVGLTAFLGLSLCLGVAIWKARYDACRAGGSGVFICVLASGGK